MSCEVIRMENSRKVAEVFVSIKSVNAALPCKNFSAFLQPYSYLNIKSLILWVNTVL